MKFVVITHVLHKKKEQKFFAYAPYVREMNLWFKYVDEVEVIAPYSLNSVSNIDLPYHHKKLKFRNIPSIEFTSIKNSILSLVKLPIILVTIFKACKKADHIHLRCPGNMGLLGALVQIFFPKKIKTAKYAGNWDPKAKQPLSYKVQKWILSNTFLTRNIQVLVYGDWGNQSKNIKPFFTATYLNSEIEKTEEKNYQDELRFVFTGSLIKGKRPGLAIKIIEELQKENKKVRLDIYGDGVLKEELMQYSTENQLENTIFFHGNQDQVVIKKALKSVHFLLLPSKSEGWPKSVAEAMFFGVIPITTGVSCVPFMLDYGKRGVIIKSNLRDALREINVQLKAVENLKMMSKNAADWSQSYTLDFFESEIAKLIKL